VTHVWLNVKNQVLRKLVKLHSSQNVNIAGVVANIFAYEYSMGRRFLRKSSTDQLYRFKTLSKFGECLFLALRQVVLVSSNGSDFIENQSKQKEATAKKI